MNLQILILKLLFLDMLHHNFIYTFLNFLIKKYKINYKNFIELCNKSKKFSLLSYAHKNTFKLFLVILYI